ncbi:uncharacterized protein [Drosophila suzukii]|uniref:Uncharacterized protein isoform X2 n=1 Tax=Drosophila suzukii TaxID=28584 RepID=A0ABM4TVH4_DROSZ
MEVFDENLRKIQVQDQNNNVDHQHVKSNIKNQGPASEVQNLTDIQGEKLPLLIEVQDHKILSESQNLEYLVHVQKVKDYLSVEELEKFSLEIKNVKQLRDAYSREKEPNQKQELDDKTQDVEEHQGELYSLENDSNQKQELDDKTEDVQRQSPPGNLDDTASERIVNRRSRTIPPMPSEETMRHSIADNLMEILVGDALQARSRILDILQRIDEKRRIRK